ncbi:hypothetical protein H2199_006937 [Coniosporium tulheliwenetii]|uniref:Uncharacterized protein n=1 Tax=Coniosporium tulheliwenetii TaxID=3383036 RepID=A0ACC2YS61_9PEZI|nr:hypothetical protein H2199_006937 [Cladosporium sp. JES 115]
MIELGVDWMKDILNASKCRPEYGLWTYGDIPPADVQFRTDALVILSTLGIGDTETQDFEREYVEPVTQFLTCILDERMRTVILGLPSYVAIGPSGKYALTGRTESKYRFAVPVPLASMPFFEDRAWLLEPVDSSPRIGTPTRALEAGQPNVSDQVTRNPPDPEDRWMLAKKQTLIGGPVIAHDGKYVKLLQKRRIYGIPLEDAAGFEE